MNLTHARVILQDNIMFLQERISSEKMSTMWSVEKCVVHFLDWWLMWESSLWEMTAWIGGPGSTREADWASPEKEPRKKYASVSSGSVPPSNFLLCLPIRLPSVLGFALRQDKINTDILRSFYPWCFTTTLGTLTRQHLQGQLSFYTLQLLHT